MLNNDEIRPLLTVREVAQLLHVHANTVRRWSDRGILKGYRITSRGDRKFKREDIARFIAELTESGGDPRETNLNKE